MSSNNTDSATDDSEPSGSTVLELSPRVEEQIDSEALPIPIRAIDHYEKSLGSELSSHPQLDVPTVKQRIELQDAVTAGMIVYTPCQIRGVYSQDTEEETSLSVVHDRYAPGDSPVVESLDSHPELFTIDTKWDITIPEGIQVLAVEPSVHTEGIVEVTPQILEPVTNSNAVSDGGSQTIPVKATVKVTQSGRVTKVNPVLQLLAIEQVQQSPSYRTMTEEEEKQVTKNERKLNIYPEWYSEQRSKDRHPRQTSPDSY